MANLGKVQLQRSGVAKKNHFVYNKDNNTSFNFGDVQPVLFHRAQTGDETHKFHFTSIIRMLDLACSTFGRSNLKLSMHFVSYDDIFPNWKNVLSAVPDTYFDGKEGFSNIPLKFPTISVDLLSMFLCTKEFASIDVYIHSKTAQNQQYAHYDQQTYSLDVLKYCFPYYQDPDATMFQASMFRSYYYQTGKYLSPDNADFVFRTDNTNTQDFIVCVKLNDRGRRLYKVLTGLEYTFDAGLHRQVDFLPLIAYYYSYFCAYSLPRYDNWLETNAYKIIRYIETFGSVTFDSVSSWSENVEDFFPLFRAFLKDLSECWYSENSDYVSCTYSPLENNPSVDQQDLSSLTYVRAGGEVSAGNVFSQLTSDSSLPSVNGTVVSSSISLDQVTDDILKKLYISIAKDSSIGYDIKKRLLSKGYHSFVEQAESHFLFSKTIPVKVYDVDSTTDNYNADTGTGKPLGAYTGKGVSSDYSGYISYTNNTPGYYIGLACVVPESRVVNALNPCHLSINRYSCYNPDYDAVGFEEVSKATVGKFRNVFYSREESSQSNTKVFGLQPRYTGLKTTVSNTLNGLFSLRSERNQWLPYTLDKIIIENNGATASNFDPSQGTFVWTDADDSEIIPVAGRTWRFPCDVAWKGNFDRIFLLSTQPQLYWDQTEGVYPDPVTDHFLCNFEISHESFAFMLPTEDSWQTIDEDKNAATMTVEN